MCRARNQGRIRRRRGGGKLARRRRDICKKKELTRTGEPGDEPPAAGNGDWPGWRGADRSGQVDWLPEALPDVPVYDWSTTLPGEGVGGLAAAEGLVVAGCRDAADESDVFVACDSLTGNVLWERRYPAPGRLDYGASPRATPLIHNGRVFTFGAFGHVHALDARTGEVLWERNLAAEFGTPKLEWGLAGSPLMADGRIILQPGGRLANLVALDPDTGDDVWQSPPGPSGHASLVVAAPGGKPQLVGFDKFSLGGWSVEDGARLWRIAPALSGDFNVPTPIVLGDRLVIATENNGTRIYGFGADGVASPRPRGEYPELAPDAHSPVAIGERVYGLGAGTLHCLDAARELAPRWTLDDPAFRDYGSLVAARSGGRLLAFTKRCELLLLEDAGDQGRIVSRVKLADDRTESLSHPALAGRTAFLRLGRELVALPLAEDE